MIICGEVEGSSDFEPFKPIEKAVLSIGLNGFFYGKERLILRRVN